MTPEEFDAVTDYDDRLRLRVDPWSAGREPTPWLKPSAMLTQNSASSCGNTN